MKTNAEVILDLLKSRPDLRAVQIADLLDMDLDVAENTLVMLSKESKVVARQVIAPNKMPSTAYSLPATALNWTAPIAIPRTPVITVATAEPELSKVQKAIAYLKTHGRVISKDLCFAMGVEYPKYSPTQYLATQIRQGEITKDGQWYQLGTQRPDNVIEKTKEPATVKPAAQAMSTGDSPTAQPAAPAMPATQPPSTSEIVSMFDFLDLSLTTDEYRGYLKANVIERTLRGDTRGAYEYAGRLVAIQA
ncbi:hypothetical protein ACO0K0_07285 [Undibacterium sp. SXout11W]|uniref:hypothetical protein n=1 Tax=Undibacterium sp. SXout11W TaxID=3413050 RepID=UPI003BF16F2D